MNTYFIHCRYPAIALILSFLISCTTATEKNAGTTEQQGKSVQQADPLPSWNEGAVKTAILSYVQDVTDPSSTTFIEEADRIATFDNDGTLWSEKPFYFQLFFAIDRVKTLAPEHPDWKDKEPFKSVLDNNMEALMKQGEKGLLEIVMASHTGITVDEFESIVKDWISTATHPEKGKLFTDLVFQPMLELLDYLKANDFKTFIVSGGGIEFMRPWSEEIYGIPRDRVVGSSVKSKYDNNNGDPVIRRLAEIEFIDDKDGKPEGINKYIGRKPVFACGNSDGDLQMLRWADANPLKSFKLYVHHTDAEREWAYDRESHIGTLDKGLDEALEKGWVFIDMAKDWKVIYPSE